MRNAVQEIGGAVERIDDPVMLAVPGLDAAALFHDEAEIGAQLGQFLLQDLFRLAVGGRNEIRRALLGNLEVFDLVEVADQAALRFTRRVRHRIDQGGSQGHGDMIASVGKGRSEEHTSELQSLMRISYAVFCLNKKKT